MPLEPERAAALRGALLDQLSPAVRGAVQRIIAAAAPKHAYAVGGVVRDLLLGRPITDIDLTTEADAIDVTMSALPGHDVTAHERFRTASVCIDVRWIDVATARSETYARPGALPDVAPGTIDEDMRRRDFSINALALRLDGDADVIDPCGGLADLGARQIRVLHDASFADDPTRLFRAIRYASRLDFQLEPDTAVLFTASVDRVAEVTGERIRRELVLMLEEPAADVGLRGALLTGLLNAVHPALRWDERNARALQDPLRARAAWPAYGLALLTRGATPEEARPIVEQLRLARDEAATIEGLAAMRGVEAMLSRPALKPSGAVVLLDRYPRDAVAVFAATTADEIAGQLARRYLEEWSAVRPRLSGLELQSLGVPVGPEIARGLKLLRAARLDGWADERRDEEVLVARFVKSIGDAAMGEAAHDG